MGKAQFLKSDRSSPPFFSETSRKSFTNKLLFHAKYFTIFIAKEKNPNISSVFGANAHYKNVNRDAAIKEIRGVKVYIFFGLARVQTLLPYLLSDLVYKTLIFKWVAAF